MTAPHPPIPWTIPEWHERADAWIKSELGRMDSHLIGPIETFQERPWSILLRVPTQRGSLFFKAVSAALTHEPVLTRALAAWRPDCIIPVLSTDSNRGWMLMPDAGLTLRNLIQSGRGIQIWREILPVYAELQIEMIPRASQILAYGAIDRRIGTLPAQLAQVILQPAILRIDQPDGLTTLEFERLRASASQLAQICARLAAYQIPETLHHDDFHDGNIFFQSERPIFADWGESCVAHPFFTMLVGLRSIAYRFQLDENASEILQLRDAYLEPWSHFASHADLISAFHLAQTLGMLGRALTWRSVIGTLDAETAAPYTDAVPGWMQDFLNSLQDKI
jgi:hypothetical protein